MNLSTKLPQVPPVAIDIQPLSGLARFLVPDVTTGRTCGNVVNK
jgi:hypothetical protein